MTIDPVAEIGIANPRPRSVRQLRGLRRSVAYSIAHSERLERIPKLIELPARHGIGGGEEQDKKEVA